MFCVMVCSGFDVATYNIPLCGGFCVLWAHFSSFSLAPIPHVALSYLKFSRSQCLIIMAESSADAITTSFVNALQFEDWLVAKQQALAVRFPCSPYLALTLAHYLGYLFYSQ